MTRRRLALAALLLAAGCPLPQSVPSVPPGSVTPPRIVEETSWPSPTSATLTTAGTTFAFDPTCPAAQGFTLTVTVADENFSEAVGYRWFVDYDPSSQPLYTPLAQGSLDPPAAEPFTLRPVKPDFVVRPAQFTPANAPHVTELVVSNGFDQSADQGALPLPYRTPITGTQKYEVQSHKWVFVPLSGCAAATTCPPCLP